MTRGALIFAFNNEHIDYVRMAAWCAERVRQHLNIPVAVVTNTADSPWLSQFDQVIAAEPQCGGGRWFSDYATHVEWYNAGRTDAYTLSPWDHTLVLDSDYVVNSDRLNRLFEANCDFLCHRRSVDITQPSNEFLNTFGRWKLPMYWATVMVFRRSNTAQYIFDAMQMIRDNWQHYRDLYGISETNYRNDYALSIALGIVSGHTGTVDAIPWDLMTTLPEHQISLMDSTLWSVNYQKADGKGYTLGIAGMDFHAMGKRNLLEVIERG